MVFRALFGCLVFLVIWGLLLLATACLAEAQQLARCGDRSAIVDTLAGKYGEALTASGLTAKEKIMEIHTSDESGSFTVLITTPDGRSCIVAHGQNWFARHSEPEGDES